ncbi:MAG: hypothetical protein AAB323_01985 [Pseudomonadota bacterium]
MTHLVPVGNGLGVQIPPHLLKAAHLDDASDLSIEVMHHGLFISLPQPKYVRGPQSKTIFDLLGTIKIEGPLDVDAAIQQAVLENDQY